MSGCTSLNVASEIDGLGVYQARAACGQRLAELEDQVLDEDCVVVPVPDTAKAAADSFAHHLKLPCMEDVIRNRYVGRTFIQPNATRENSVRSKYTPLLSVLSGERVFLLEDSIVRSTTLKSLVHRIKENCGAKEVHVRVACPPIVGPCFYSIDMSTIGELFAPGFLPSRYSGKLKPQALSKMARRLGVSSLRYLPVPDLVTGIGCDDETLCLGCVTGKYPTTWGKRLMRRARENHQRSISGRTYET